MGNRTGERGDGITGSNSDLERFRKNLLDRPAEEVAGNDNSSKADASGNTFNHYGATTGQVLFIGGIASFALGVAIAALVMMTLRDNSQGRERQQSENRLMEQMRKTETEARMVQYYLQDPSFRTKAELEEWARYKGIQDQQEKQQ